MANAVGFVYRNRNEFLPVELHLASKELTSIQLLFFRLMLIHFNTIKNTLYALPFALASLMPMNSNGQQRITSPPPGHINLFISQDTTENAKTYNSLKTKEERDQFINDRLKEDWVDQIKPRFSPTVWNCNQFALQLIINSHDWGEEILYGDKPLYNNYYGFELEQIYENYGTLKD